MTLRYKARRFWNALRGLLFHRQDADYWMAEWLRGLTHNDRGRMKRADRRLISVPGVPRGGLLVPQPLAEVLRIKRELERAAE